MLQCTICLSHCISPYYIIMDHRYLLYIVHICSLRVKTKMPTTALDLFCRENVIFVSCRIGNRTKRFCPLSQMKIDVRVNTPSTSFLNLLSEEYSTGNRIISEYQWNKSWWLERVYLLERKKNSIYCWQFHRLTIEEKRNTIARIPSSKNTNWTLLLLFKLGEKMLWTHFWRHFSKWNPHSPIF
jgi:hypothetical protein